MFSLASGIYQNYFATPQINVLLIGMESVGKTSLLERLKVTQFSKKGPVTATTNATNSTSATAAVKRSLSCPAPPKYAISKVLEDEEDDDSLENSPSERRQQPASASAASSIAKKWLSEKQQSSLEDIEWKPQPPPPPETTSQPTTATTKTVLPPASHEERRRTSQNYNLKPGQKMLPLEKIRPTSGQNLAKIDICGAKCHVFDLCGKFRDLWERYYNDAEAVIFCWKLGNDTILADEQAKILEKVRREIPDDVPILIFGHVMNENDDGDDDVQFPLTLPTQLFLPNYHSNVMQVYCGIAKTGKNVREAMEWLIPLAKRQAALRAPRSDALVLDKL